LHTFLVGKREDLKMVESSGVYTGSLHCDLTHGPSGQVISTDAPKDNNGKGEAFSPTDLVGAALGSCILTTIAMVAERDGIDIKGAKYRVTKEMTAPPEKRKIARLAVTLQLPSSVPTSHRKKFETVAHTCPVHRSLGPDVQMPITFDWNL
jgi:putative redox protein